MIWESLYYITSIVMALLIYYSTEAVVVRGLFTLTTVSYQSSFDREGSSDLPQLTSQLTHQVDNYLLLSISFQI